MNHFRLSASIDILRAIKRSAGFESDENFSQFMQWTATSAKVGDSAEGNLTPIKTANDTVDHTAAFVDGFFKSQINFIKVLFRFIKSLLEK